MYDLLCKIQTLSKNSIIDEKVHYDGTIKSAVFFLFLKNSEGFSILLLKRSNYLNNHPGEICFPGGTYKPEDGNLITTAFRETFEESGISRRNIKWVSALNYEDTRTGFRIYPFIGVIENEDIINIDNSEIVKYITVSVKQLREVLNLKKLWFTNNNALYSKPLFYFKDELIWGATANIIYNFFTKYNLVQNAK